jgi:hypothetical protein
MGGDETAENLKPFTENEPELGEGVEVEILFFFLNSIKSSEPHSERGSNWVRFFNEGYDCLGMKPSAEGILKKGISAAISLQRAVVSQAASMLERHDAITRLKCFRYAIVSRSSGGSNVLGSMEGSGSSESLFGRPAVLSKLAYFLLTVQVGRSLVPSADRITDRERGMGWETFQAPHLGCRKTE